MVKCRNGRPFSTVIYRVVGMLISRTSIERKCLQAMVQLDRPSGRGPEPPPEFPNLGVGGQPGLCHRLPIPIRKQPGTRVRIPAAAPRFHSLGFQPVWYQGQSIYLTIWIASSESYYAAQEYCWNSSVFNSAYRINSITNNFHIIPQLLFDSGCSRKLCGERDSVKRVPISFNDRVAGCWIDKHVTTRFFKPSSA